MSWTLPKPAGRLPVSGCHRPVTVHEQVQQMPILDCQRDAMRRWRGGATDDKYLGVQVAEHVIGQHQFRDGNNLTDEQAWCDLCCCKDIQACCPD